MKQIKGPALFLAQFAGDEAPFNSLETIVEWAASIGYKGVQIPTWDVRIFDLEKAASSKEYCNGVIATCAKYGVEITELSTHLQGQLVACHPAYDTLFNGFAPEKAHDSHEAKEKWATEQMMMAAKASGHMGLTAHVTFPGALLWHTVYPWPQRPAGLVDEGFKELARRWKPILDAFDEVGCDVCYEIHPGEDLHDGASFERFLKAVDDHPRANILYDPSHLILQGMDYLSFIHIYHDRIKMFHVKDAELNCDGRSGVYGGYQDWIDRPGRFRSLGDGQVDFKAIFSALTQYDFDGWAVVEWECCMKHPEDGAREGADFVNEHIIRPSEYSFDDFAGGSSDDDLNKKLIGIK
jgi:sugar phosphate isomerase/epimerase